LSNDCKTLKRVSRDTVNKYHLPLDPLINEQDDWEGTILDILEMDIHVEDKLSAIFSVAEFEILDELKILFEWISSSELEMLGVDKFRQYNEEVLDQRINHLKETSKDAEVNVIMRIPIFYLIRPILDCIYSTGFREDSYILAKKIVLAKLRNIVSGRNVDSNEPLSNYFYKGDYQCLTTN